MLAHSYEYRQPSSKELAKAAGEAHGDNVKVDMSSRYLGLIVIPGHHITKLEVEEFASQMGNENFI